MIEIIFELIIPGILIISLILSFHSNAKIIRLTKERIESNDKLIQSNKERIKASGNLTEVLKKHDEELKKWRGVE